MSAKITIGLHTSTQKALHIRDSGNGLACGCTCFGCKEPLIANQGKKKDWHFSHHSDSDCSGGLETALHKLAKEIIVESESMVFPKYEKLNYRNSTSEKPLKSFRPDVSAELEDGVQIYFEIFHRHKNTERKNTFYKTSKLKSVEIDMSGCPLNSRDSIKNFVLNVPKNKSIIYWEDELNTISKTSYKIDFKLISVLVLGLIALVSVIVNFTKSKKNKFIN
ncbi:competence protein CoiA family protein [Pedobacter cryophilus]|uniref:Competence protein CoiA-like N-terminal domain-containing protein n=1 Tax=Pedobacter cryophilus TaxID=2571271 RepID=A0A4U1BU13_9SPHI|nr:competence protein CoiA family protein [Pedobacter cryophilus]TKB95738.1 hypothetical protein FA046_15720 [Pedobacter cryophilus]